MVTIGSVQNEIISGYEVDPFALRFLNNTFRPRSQKININQLSDGNFTELEESTGVTIALIGKTELTLVGASSDNHNNYDLQTITITYKSNNGVTHNAIMLMDPVDSTNEEVFYKFGTSSDGSKYVDGVTAVIDFYCLLTMVSSFDPEAGHSFGLGSTGVLTYGVIQAGALAAVAADIHGIGDVFVRGIDDTASLQSKDNVFVYFTPWGEQKNAIASTVANATTEVRWINAAGVFVGDFYRLLTWTTETVPAGGKNLIIGEAEITNVDGSTGEVYGMIEEAIKESLHSRFFAAPNRITFIHFVEMDFPAAAAASVLLQLNYQPKGHAHKVILQHTVFGHHQDDFDLEIEPDTDFTFKIADIAAPATGDYQISILYGQLTDKTSQSLVGAV